jgi:hypothetical protein
MDHAENGELKPTEHHALMSMLLLVDAKTGRWRGSARALTTILGYKGQRTMDEALRHLEEGGYILRDFEPHSKGNFPILIDKFEITNGRNAKRRIDLTATKHKYGIPSGLIDLEARKQLLDVITKACRNPVFSDQGDPGGDDAKLLGDDRGDDRGDVSTRERRDGEEEGGSPSLRSVKSEASECPAAFPAFASEPTSVMTPAEQLATRFFNFQERPEKLNSALTVSSWTSTFERLIGQYGFDDLSGCLHWAFEVDPFWPSQLIRRQNPLGYFETQLTKQLLSRYRQWKTGEASVTTPQHKKGNPHGRSQSNTVTKGPGGQLAGNQAAGDEARRRFEQRLAALSQL